MTDQTTSRFKVAPTLLAGAATVVRLEVVDPRGSLSRLFCAQDLWRMGWQWPVAQINRSTTKTKGTVRGLHYQHPPHAEAKLVTCLRGRVWDVALDLRVGSPTFLKWCAHELSADNYTAMLIPPGCAHGFQSLSDDVELLYVHSAPYTPHADAGLNPLDPRLAITWPLPMGHISERDINRPLLGGRFEGLQP
jgi:dTDP-4-dehydrorhamnose 3,5-epimerase